MNISFTDVKYTDAKELSVQIEFAVACAKVNGDELIGLRLTNTEVISRFRNAASKIIRTMKRDGVVRLFVFEDELGDREKTESIFLINKFPTLSSIDQKNGNIVYIKI